MKKWLEAWNNRSISERVVSIVAVVLFLIYVIVLCIGAFGDVESFGVVNIKGLGNIIMSVLWGLLGSAWWTKNKKVGILYFCIATCYLILGIVMML